MVTQRRVKLRESVPIMVFMTFVMMSFVSQTRAMIVAGAAGCVIYALGARAGRGLSRDVWRVLGIACLLFIPGFANSYHGLSPVFYFLSTVGTFFAALAVSRKDPAILAMAFRWMYWAAVLAISWGLYTYLGYPEPLGMLIEGSSTNGIPAYLIVLQVSLSLATFLATGRLPVVSTLFTFAVAFIGNGRGSLVIAAAIILATLMLNAFVAQRYKPGLRIVALVSLLLAVFAMMLWGGDLLDIVYGHTKLSVGLVDSNRLEILEQYMRKIDGFTLLFGADYAGTVIEYEYLGNPHIAYIRTHSFFGLPLTLLALISPCLVLLARKVRTAKLVFFVFIGLAALRASSEPLFFPTLLDFFYFSWFLMYLKHAEPARQSPAVVLREAPRHA